MDYSVAVRTVCRCTHLGTWVLNSMGGTCLNQFLSGKWSSLLVLEESIAFDSHNPQAEGGWSSEDVYAVAISHRSRFFRCKAPFIFFFGQCHPLCGFDPSCSLNNIVRPGLA